MKMKKLVGILMACVLSVGLLTACGASSTADASAEAESSEETDSGEAEAAEESDKTYKVAMVVQSSVNDGGWGSSCYNGMLTAAEAMGWETAYTEEVEESDFVSAFTDYANLGYDMIFAPGNQYQDACLEVAKSYPDVHFAVLNGSVYSENVCSLQYDNTAVGFLGGLLAGLMTKTGHVGDLGASQITSALQMYDGYEQGVLYANPDATVDVAWTDTFSDPAKGKELATSMIATSDVDVIFGMSSGCDVGMREAVKEAGIYTIVQPSMALMEDIPEQTLGCIVIDTPRLIQLAMEKIVDGSFGNEIIEGGIADDVVYVGAVGDAAAEVKDEYLAMVDKVISGEITYDVNVTLE